MSLRKARKPAVETEFSQLARRGRTSPWRYLLSVLILLSLWLGSGYLFLEIPAFIADVDGNPLRRLEEQ